MLQTAIPTAFVPVTTMGDQPVMPIGDDAAPVIQTGSEDIIEAPPEIVPDINPETETDSETEKGPNAPDSGSEVERGSGGPVRND
jgi:hypothetical protein